MHLHTLVKKVRTPMRKILLAFLLPKVISYLKRRYGGGRAQPQRRSF